MKTTSRRQFLWGVGGSVGSAAVGLALAQRLGFAQAPSVGAPERLGFGALDPLVDLMQATPADELMPLVVARLRAGTQLGDVVAAAALANARAYGGTNYDGYHTLMAMVPSLEMAASMPAPLAPLPVLKVLHRNARFLQDTGRAHEDALAPLAAPGEAERAGSLVESVRARELARAERALAAGVRGSTLSAYEELQEVVRDEMNVHRVVLAWRAYDLVRLTGSGQALSLLRQCVRFCVDEDAQRLQRGRPESAIRSLLPALLAEHGLDRRPRGTRAADEAWIERLAEVLFSSESEAAARAAARVLAEGFDPEDVGAAMSLAATRLLLHDPGQRQASPGKPVGSVHGASVGVHASDAANAWRHIARVGGARNAFASLIAGAYHTAGQGQHVGALAHDHDAPSCTKDDPAALRSEIEGRIRERDQKGACQAARRYCALGHSSEELFSLLLGFAVSEDGALHAEKYFRTAQDEHALARAAHRPLYLAALTRVMASHHGFPAPGGEQARELLAG